MKPLKSGINEEDHNPDSGDGGGQEAVSGQGVGAQNEVVRIDEGSVGSGVEPKVRFKPKGTSITLEGCGRRDGSDVNNSMGLLEAYRMILEGGE